MFNPNTQGSFAARPRVVEAQTKYRPEAEPPQGPVNIHSDPRVIRGNTYAPMPVVTAPKESTMRSNANSKKRTFAKTLETTGYEAVQADVSTPRPVDGRKHIEVQTDENIEILTDRPPEYERDTQTDFYIDRPVNRLFVPQKIGEDKETQIWEGELFDFDTEVEPILQVLIGKTLEQGRMEVLEEEELKIMKEEKRRYDDLRYAELVEAQKMEAEETRKLEESDRRKKQHRYQKEQSVAGHKKLVSRILAKEYLKNVHANTFRILEEQGTFQNAFRFEINHTLMPWIYNDILELQEGRGASVNTIRTLSSTVAYNLEYLHEQAIKAHKDKLRAIQEEKERKEREKIERREKRAEARRQRDEEERRKVLKEKIAQVLVARGEQRQHIFSQILSDLDSLGKEGMTVGLLGGIIGEILIVLSALEDYKDAQPENPPVSLKGVEVTPEIVQKIVEYVVGELVKDGKVEIGVTGDIEAQLQAIDSTLTLDNLQNNTSQEVRDILAASINSFGLNAIRENTAQLGLRNEYAQMIIDAITNLVLSADDKAKKIKLVKAPLDYSEDTRYEAIAVLMPNIEEAPIFNLQDAKGLKQPKKGKRPSKKGSQSTIEDPLKSEDGEPPVITPADIDYEDVVSVFPLYNDQLRVMVHQRPASIVFRREVLLFLSSLFKELDMKEIEILKKANSKDEGIEDIVAKKFEKNLAVLSFEKS